MRSKKHSKKTKKTRTRTKRTYKKGGDTSSDIIRLEEGLGPRKDTYVIDIKPSSSPTARSRARSSSSIPLPPFGTPPPFSDSDSFKSAIEEILQNPLPPKNSFPYKRVVVDPDDIEGVVYDNRPFPPKASPVYYTSSTPSAPKIRPMPPTSYELARADSEDRKIPLILTKSPSPVFFTRYGNVLNQEYNPSSRAMGIGRKTRKRHNKRSKKHKK
jgi:hypothetical protein